MQKGIRFLREGVVRQHSFYHGEGGIELGEAWEGVAAGVAVGGVDNVRDED